MLSFEKTSLWRESFENQEYADYPDVLHTLRVSLLNFRERTKFLVDQIPRNIPGLTVHDITHLDALWETASLIAGEGYPINPAEAFVFGGAVLLHDSAMSLAAYPGGLEEVRRTPQWEDAVANRLMTSLGEAMERSHLDSPPEHIVSAALGDVLRVTHSTRAAELPFVKWQGADGSEEFLIQDSDLRSSYGSIIGEIAASHWWSVAELRKLQPRVNAGGKVPAAWFVNPLKIACLLRAADAAHIDHRRAPRFLRSLIVPQGDSGSHWTFQSKLGKPSTDKNFLVYTGSPFNVSEAEAWWLGYDMITSIDDELRAVHGALDGKKVHPFAISAVKGAKSPEAVAEVIPTRHWIPVNTELQVSDVPSLVALLGGEHLYGSDLSASLREILQNAADSIMARRLLSELDPKSCMIKVSLSRTKAGDILEFEDDGIGMSQRVLTGALLDFGRSFWRGGAIRQEFPGLLSKGLRTTGRFGIGFFSVFMFGDRVTVTSRRYDAAASDTHTLDFQKGLRMRPILRKPDGNEALRQAGTKVRVVLKTPYDEPGGLLFKGGNGKEKILQSLNAMVARVSPAVDVTIETDECGNVEVAVSAKDWMTAEPDKLVSRWGSSRTDSKIKSVLTHLRPLLDSSTGMLHGRACIFGGYRWVSEGVVTVGGFRATELRSIGGVLVGETETVARNSARPTVPAAVLRSWATEQANIIADSNVPGREQLDAASVVMLCGGDASRLPIATLDGEYLTATSIFETVKGMDEVLVYEGQEVEYDEDDDVGPRSFENGFVVSPSLFLVPRKASSLLTVGKEEWPASIPDLYLSETPTNCEESFLAILARAWGAEPNYDRDSRVVGELFSSDILRLVEVYTRSLDTSDSEV